MADSKNTPPAERGSKPNPWDRIPDLPADHPLFKAGFVIGQRTRPVDLFPPLPADHPLFRAGFVVGQRRAASSKDKPSEGG